MEVLIGELLFQAAVRDVVMVDGSGSKASS